MRFNLHAPCAQCPFRTDCRRGWLGRRRAAEIAHAVGREGKTFACHKTVDYDAARTGDESHCAGAAILQEKIELRPGRSVHEGRGAMLQVAGRLGLYDPAALDLAAPVFETFGEFVSHHSEDLP